MARSYEGRGRARAVREVSVWGPNRITYNRIAYRAQVKQATLLLPQGTHAVLAHSGDWCSCRTASSLHLRISELQVVEEQSRVDEDVIINDEVEVAVREAVI